ncbi:MAG: SAF domain-containing protein [Propionibacteriaceae bacterium]
MGTAPLHQRLVRVLSWHRRKLAAGLAAIAVVAGINAAAPPDPPTVAVLVTARAVPAGRILAADDLSTVRWPRGQLPDGAVSDPAQVLGRPAVAAVPRGQTVTDLTTLSLRQAGPGRSIVALRLADPDLAVLLRPGDVVDVVAADDQSGTAAVIARRVRVVTTPSSPAEPGLLGTGGGSGPGGVLCLIEVDQGVTATLAGAAVRRQLSVVWAR